uniref:BOD1/SHG1 domain-containing protein n=1 Tax=Glossina brevipalpis TaxID=37001 RepID=A0A1A9WY37_9MUSC
MDTQFVEKIVHEVKSQGVFDEFRKDSMADVDTKPAYQNLRKRVEDSVKKFLAQQKWTPEINKNQLREKLRRHIAESGFLDVGVERIVDQVVNPKIGSVFQPRIEEIAYKYLGIPPPPKKYEPPPPPLIHPLPPLPMSGQPLKVQTSDLLPNDLEQVSPDSDKATVKSEEGGDGECDMEIENDNRTQDDDDESPPFEPLGNEEKTVISLKDAIEFNIKTENKDEAHKKQNQQSHENVRDTALPTKENQRSTNCAQENEVLDTDRETSQSLEAKVSQISQLSSVSNDSFPETSKPVLEGSHSQEEAVAANISEEAQMPKFNENSSETCACAELSKGKEFQLHFDINKDEIKFEGTERKINTLSRQKSPSPLKGVEPKEIVQEETEKIDENKSAFKFVAYNNGNGNVEIPAASSTQKSVDSFADDTTSSAPLVIASDAEVGFKEKETLTEHRLPLKTTKGQMSGNASTPVTTGVQNIMTSPLTDQVRGSEYCSTKHSSSSSSRHKKHAKEHRRSHDKERDSHRHSSKVSKDERSKDKYHHRSSSSGSSSHNKHISSKTKHSSSATHKDNSKHLKHSLSLSIEKDKQRYNQYKESSCSSTTSSKRSERKDDHSEVKTKLTKRKSTDSNDENGKSSGTYGTQTLLSKPGNQVTSSSAKSKPKPNGDTKKTSTTKTNAKTSDLNESEVHREHHNKVVILNDILENPQTNFIALDVRTSSNTGAQVTVSTNKTELLASSTSFNPSIEVPIEKENEINENSPSDLLFFEERVQQFSERLKLLDVVIDSCRRSISKFRFDPSEREYNERFFLSDDDELHNNNNHHAGGYLIKKMEYNYSTIRIDNKTLQQQFEPTPCKHFKLNEVDKCTVTVKTSPISSDSGSFNSKENENVDKNETGIESNSKSVHLKDRLKTVQKLTQQQRYTSEDLYKPRPILGQRSRRRGMMDTVL